MADEKTQELDIQAISELQSVTEEVNMTDIKIQMLALAKDVLERNAALQWEQDKTRGLTITVDEIIGQAQKLINFVVG